MICRIKLKLLLWMLDDVKLMIILFVVIFWDWGRIFFRLIAFKVNLVMLYLLDGYIFVIFVVLFVIKIILRLYLAIVLVKKEIL